MDRFQYIIHGYDVWELPPNGQGNRCIDGIEYIEGISVYQRDEEMFHHQFEAMKMAFADGLHHITDAKI